MTDYKQARLSMIDTQLRPSGVTAAELLRAILAVPRELFVADNRRTVAHVDDLQPLGDGRFMLSPAHFGRLANLAKIGLSDRVLDVGAGSGYSTAVLAHVAREVVGIEANIGLAAKAEKHLHALHLANAKVVHGGSEAVAGETFDAIVVEGALDERPEDLIALLAHDGRLVAPILDDGVAVVQVFRRQGGGVMFTSEFDATMPRLRTSSPHEEFVF